MQAEHDTTTTGAAVPVRLSFLLLAACSLLLAACGGGDDGTASDDGDAAPKLAEAGTTITMRSNEFSPQTATVAAGEVVTFENADGYDHNVRGDGIDIGDFSSGSQTVTVGEPGTIDYECTLHEGMTGTIEVVEPSEA